MTHICVSQLIIIVSDNGSSPDRRQAIIWNNHGILLFGPVGRNFSEILIKIYTFSFKKMHLKMSSGKWRPSCLGLNVLITTDHMSSLLSSSEVAWRSHGWHNCSMHSLACHNILQIGSSANHMDKAVHRLRAAMVTVGCHTGCTDRSGSGAGRNRLRSQDMELKIRQTVKSSW